MDAPSASKQKALFRRCRQLRKQGDDEAVAELLVDALRRYRLDAEGVLHAGRMLSQIDEAAGNIPRYDVSILGQCTTSWIVPALTAVARGRGQQLHVDDVDYDNVLQEASVLDPKTDAVVLVPWTQRLFGESIQPAAERIDDELGFWQGVWAILAKRGDLHVVQVGYDWTDAGASGHHLGSLSGGEIDVIRRLNDRLRERLPAGTYFVDLEQVSGSAGRDTFYDRRRYFWTKQPFSDAGVVRLSEHLWAGLRAASLGPKKVLVLDLDNTIWGGVVGEVGPLGIELGETPAGEAFRDFQQLARSLADRGSLIAVCSKNNPDDAREPFEKNPDMVLTLDDIVAFEAGWAPKADVVRDMAARLRLGLDSFVFFDDDPAERELIRQVLPEVEVVEVPEDPARYRQALLDGLWFESVSVSDEDRMRTQQYQVERQRQQSRDLSGSVEDYLHSLEMRGAIGAINEYSIERVVQLIGKTNQFNLTSRRHSRDAVVAKLDNPETVALTLRLRDRFGDYGLVSVIIATGDRSANASDLRIDTWLMSCRVIGRTAEQFLFNALVNEAKSRGSSRLVGEFLPTKKNAVVAGLYERLGFSKCDDRSECATFELDLADIEPQATCVVDASSDA